jgi:hypothetical protein
MQHVGFFECSIGSSEGLFSSQGHKTKEEWTYIYVHAKFENSIAMFNLSTFDCALDF